MVTLLSDERHHCREGCRHLQVVGGHKKAKAAVHRLGHVVRLVAKHGDAHQRHAMVGGLRPHAALLRLCL